MLVSKYLPAVFKKCSYCQVEKYVVVVDQNYITLVDHKI